jgi:hypothetical protein
MYGNSPTSKVLGPHDPAVEGFEMAFSICSSSMLWKESTAEVESEWDSEMGSVRLGNKDHCAGEDS